ncbi:hypothetical protein HNY73_012518 [Argiope bruennichi]|uniref:Uncharacterized protein n=1 Tax=Argiope bruennichi TaxID=94029 RepID=A0A8T0EZX9_ARGBR|nr:hypothetical protein HNY73_012518 [Argiope bruennichi]
MRLFNCIGEKRLSPTFRLGWHSLPTHWRNPVTTRCGDFCLLRFRPGPIRPSLVDLVNPSSPRSTISTPCLARTPDQHGKVEDRTPNLKPSSALTSRVAGLQDHANGPSRSGAFSLLHKDVTTLEIRRIFDTASVFSET